MDDDWKRYLGQKTKDQTQTSANRPLTPLDIMMASMCLAIGMSLALLSFLFEYNVNKTSKEERKRKANLWGIQQLT